VFDARVIDRYFFRTDVRIRPDDGRDQRNHRQQAAYLSEDECHCCAWERSGRADKSRARLRKLVNSPTTRR